jgi:outer membrane murein-binding lipoprotein Lpp
MHRWQGLIGAICSIGLLIAASGTLTVAQTQDAQSPDQQELQKRVQQLEQEVRQLQDQIKAAGEKAPPSEEKAPPSEESGPPPAAVGKAVARGEQPEQAKQAAEKEKKSSIDLYGFAMLDSGYQFRQNDPAWFDVVRPTKLPSFPNEFAPNGKVFFGVRQSRLGVKSLTPTRFGDLKTIFEFELFGTGVNAGQTTFRLRHAYGELPHVGAGQTWSPFMDPDVFPNSLEYWGPSGMVFFRTVQARVMPVNNDRMRIIFAAEQPGASADQGVYSGRVELQNIRTKFDMPDFSLQGRLMGDWGHLQIAGILRKITWVDVTPNPTFRLGDTVLGWGVNISSNINFTKKDVGRFQVVYGKGIENYMNDAPVDIATKSNLSNPIRPVLGVPLPVLGVVSFLDHKWSDHYSTSLGYSLVNIENTNGQIPRDFHQGHYALGNLLYHPVSAVTIGSEFQFGRRINFSDGFNVNDYRVQFSFKYAFEKKFEFGGVK